MAPKQKMDIDKLIAQLDLRRLNVSPTVKTILELGGMIHFLEKFDDHNEDLSR